MSRNKILVVDDDEGLQRILGVTLGDDDFDLRYASDGDDAIELAKSFQPDLLLLDIMMPNVNGYQVCEALKRDPACQHIKIIMLTAASSEEDRARGLACGADDYFGKPFSPAKLLNRIYELIEV